MSKKIIIGLAGEIASGKGTIAKYCIERHGGESYRFSTILRDVVRRLHLPETRDTIQRASTLLRKEFGEDLLAKVIFEDAKAATGNVIVVDGVRRLEDVKYLRELPEFKLLYITAPMKTRYERIVKRGENEDDNNKTWEEFQKDHQRESELEIPKLEAFAQEVIDNSGTYPDLYRQIDDLIKKYGSA